MIEAFKKLRLTVHSEVRKICQEIGGQVDMEMNKAATSLVAEFIWKKMQVVSKDLECFAKHAKRSTINAEDVKLLTRRNPSLRTTICQMADETAKKKRLSKDKDKDKEVEELDGAGGSGL
ncbi:centromere protein S-like isoform X2 [Periplaneta americana]|uniref:centromere protein S-like isoform X2 n=1 Tax=Periplaneta americana TaxID=6978 RepID=UPI0037E8926D